MIGKCISHYHILEKLDDGGMGVVFKAEDVKLSRLVALKFLPAALCDDEEAKERFIREAKAASSLDHPNICTIYEIGETDEGQLFIAMAYYEGETLHRKISRGPVPVAEAVDYARQIASGLSKSHELDIIHRDIKPANAFVTRDGQVKILDFGLAKVLGEGVTLTGLAQGTPAYMAPERIRNEKASPRTDLWSLGVLLYEALAGRRPFTGASVAEIISNVHRHEPEDLHRIRPEVPESLAATVRRLMSKNPKGRHRDCDHLIEELNGASDDGTQTATVSMVAGSLKPAGLPVLAWSLRLLLPAFLVMVTAALVTLAVMQRPQEPQDPEAVRLATIFLGNAPEDLGLEPFSIGQRIVESIDRSPNIHVLSQDAVAQVVEEMGGHAALADSTADFRRLAERLDVDAMLVGRITQAGEGLRIGIRLREGRTGDVLYEMSIDVPSKEELLPRVDDLSLGIRKHYELPPAEPMDPDMDRSKVTTYSVEAWREYTEGIRRHREYKELAAAVLFERAVELDPEFGMAWATLAAVQLNLNRPQWRTSVQEAMKFVQSLTPREAAYIRGLDAFGNVRTWPEAVSFFQEALKLDPGFLSARQSLAFLCHLLERYEDSVRHGEILASSEAPYRGVYATLAENKAALGNMEAARQILNDAGRRWPGDFALEIAMGRLELRRQAFGEALVRFGAAEEAEPARALVLDGRCHAHLLREEWQQASDLVAEEFKELALRASADWCQILVDLYRGRSAEALAKARDSAVEMPAGPARSSLRLAAARILLLRGEADAALEEVESARDEARGHPLEAWALFYEAQVKIRLGRVEAAKVIAEELGVLTAASSHPQIERFRRHVQGLAALAEKRYADAIATLEAAAASLPAHGLRSFFHEPDHVPLWASLAAAYEAQGDARQAARVREKIVHSAEERIYYPGIYVRSLYELGKYHAAQGEEDAARSYFESFRDYWSQGDLSREWLSELPL